MKTLLTTLAIFAIFIVGISILSLFADFCLNIDNGVLGFLLLVSPVVLFASVMTAHGK